eukprot:3262306-Karenia_brevis.AAC.1
MFSNAIIKRIVVISNDAVKEWIPKIIVEEHQGEQMEYIKIGKGDRNFVRFCTGKTLDLRKGK